MKFLRSWLYHTARKRAGAFPMDSALPEGAGAAPRHAAAFALLVSSSSPAGPLGVSILPLPPRQPFPSGKAAS